MLSSMFESFGIFRPKRMLSDQDLRRYRMDVHVTPIDGFLCIDEAIAKTLVRGNPFYFHSQFQFLAAYKYKLFYYDMHLHNFSH